MLRVRLVNCLAVLVITIAAVPPLGSSHPQPQLEDLEKRGRAALRRGHYGKALDTFEALVAREPLNPSYHYGKGVALSSLLDHGAAVDALEEAVALDPQFAPAFQQLVIVYSQLARTESTLAAFQKARSLGPVPESMRLPLARALRERDLFEEALSVLEGSATAEATFERGIIEMERGDYERAAEHLETATSDPVISSSAAEYEYGRCLEQLDEPERAIEHLPPRTRKGSEPRASAFAPRQSPH